MENIPKGIKTAMTITMQLGEHKDVAEGLKILANVTSNFILTNAKKDKTIAATEEYCYNLKQMINTYIDLGVRDIIEGIKTKAEAEACLQESIEKDAEEFGEFDFRNN